MSEATPSEPGHSPWLYETREVALTDIAVLTRLRALEPAVVDTLAASMKLAGLTHAIVLRSAPTVEAARKLGWQTIRAVIFSNLTSDQAALLEIESNLIPTLTPDERAKRIPAQEETTEGRRGWKAGVREFFGLRSE